MYRVPTRSWILICVWTQSLNTDTSVQIHHLLETCWDNWWNHVHTMYIHVHTLYRHVHTLYIGTTRCIDVPLRYIPRYTRLYSLCNRYWQCYSAGICHTVHAVFIHPKNCCGRWSAFLQHLLKNVYIHVCTMNMNISKCM